jgi:3-oxoacyl-[acyl-carrier-protein] synthase III
MRYENVCLQSFGYEVPPEVVPSAALEDALAPVYEKLSLSPGRIELMSGVRERRFWEHGTRPSSVSIRTARQALERAGIAPSRVGALVHSSVCRDFLEPATANVVAAALGVSASAMVFDISNACLGFMNGIMTVANMIELGQIEAGVVVSTENGRPLVDSTVADLVRRSKNGLTRKDVKPAFASLTIGSGSVATVIVRRDLARGPHGRLLGGAVRQATEHHALCRSAPDHGFASDVQTLTLMETDAEAVLTHGCKLARTTWKALEGELGWQEQPERIFCHQVGSSYRRALFEALGLDLGREYPTLEWLGNVGSVSLPISMALAQDAGRLVGGDRVAMLGIGSGLNCVMLGLDWAA